MFSRSEGVNFFGRGQCMYDHRQPQWTTTSGGGMLMFAEWPGDRSVACNMQEFASLPFPASVPAPMESTRRPCIVVFSVNEVKLSDEKAERKSEIDGIIPCVPIKSAYADTYVRTLSSFFNFLMFPPRGARFPNFLYRPLASSDLPLVASSSRSAENGRVDGFKGLFDLR
jgi:hypothetical protein